MNSFYSYRLYLMVSLTLVIGCSEKILEVENRNTLTTENFYQTSKDFEMALNSCYEPLMRKGLFKHGFNIVLQSWSDHVICESITMDKMDIKPDNDIVDLIWSDLYMGVYRTSKFLEICKEKEYTDIQNMDREFYLNLVAQARTLRGVYYFYLVVLFHEPVFYNEDNIPYEYTKKLSNGNPAQFWDQMETDFEQAIPDLKYKSELSENDLSRVTKGGARSMLAKSLLYKHYHFHVQNGNNQSDEDVEDLNRAKQLLEEVIGSNEYQLVKIKEPKSKKDYLFAILSNSAFLDLKTEGGNLYKAENNEESVWEIQFIEATTNYGSWWPPDNHIPGEMAVMYCSPHRESYKIHEVNPAFYDVFETQGVPAGFDRDPRMEATFYLTGDTMDFRKDSPYHQPFNPLICTRMHAKKRDLPFPEAIESGIGFQKHFFPVFYNHVYAPIYSPTNKRMMRYADVLLLFAEVDFLLGNLTGDGLNALNMVRTRVGMQPVEMFSVEAIKHEREVELAYEWSRYADLVRWSFDPSWNVRFEELNWGIDPENSVIPFKQGKNEYLPIPQAEIDMNGGKLKQNRGW